MYRRSIRLFLSVNLRSTSVTCRGYRSCLVWNSMALRCLLFSSNKEMIQPIWQVLTDLGIEAEYCNNAVDAVERVTTQLFQIVITDWEDQPEAAFLLKTARDLKAAHRPLTLAIVSDDARLPEALQAGANSVLIKPIRTEQVRDTMSTACELLRAKLQHNATVREGPAAMAAAASASVAPAGAASVRTSSGAAAAPASVTQAPENAFRAGEFLQLQSSTPGTQFDTESDVQKSLDHVAAAELDALTELEPVAAAVEPPAEQAVEPPAPLSGWIALQARLTKSAPPPAENDSPKNELLSYGETPAYGEPVASPGEGNPAEKDSQPESREEAALFAYLSGQSQGTAEPVEPLPKGGKAIMGIALALACVVLLAVPQSRKALETFYRGALRAGGAWLNPQPVPVQQSPPQHDSFGQAGDEYKLPIARNIPDATTDPSQIRVLPVIDPTAKAAKASEANNQQSQAAGDQTPSDQNPDEPVHPEQGRASGLVAPNSADTPGNAGGASLAPVTQVVAPESDTPILPAVAAPPRPVAPPVQSPAPSHVVSLPSNAAIPSSLKSRTASITPEASGAMPVEAAMSSIEPVKLPESIAWGLLAQPVDPIYPDAGKASRQAGSVVLQVLIGRDGVVQDAKFLQGSLVFARAAIDAVKQWRFRPYLLNGRAVSVQSVITLNFKPPA